MRAIWPRLRSGRLSAPAVVGLVLLTAGLAALAAGPTPFARMALGLGLPSLAAALYEAPGAKGVALYEMGDYAAADRAFAQSGKDSTYNRGLSLAMNGHYHLAVAYFDAVLFIDPNDADARHNREVVHALDRVIVGDAVRLDGIAATVAAPDSDSVVTERDLLNSTVPTPPPDIRDPRIGQSVAASAGWLETLPDEPGLYLKRRIRAEHERRQDLGLANPPEDDAW